MKILMMMRFHNNIWFTVFLDSIEQTVRTITNCDIQLKRDEDEYYHEYMHLKNAESASNVVLIHHSIVKGREAYIQIKRFNKGEVEIRSVVGL
ncbi:hypothetical protein KY290_033539 [Solanum tuberosum]|uniref:Uncharacterized protein n=1 Tax=Solanum tuberosum TaxID=4113 RepID=A0ABQ7U105_SOLTU|nr:hypothetical protein KY289_032899 [Solanum tuberosum]KAH0647546.1 hypothetical protein KY285_032794 [Solanum tuberosum]KAH0740496.1 hypothetical protein KY290_033539 [Solanum tuberosum]